MKTDIHEVLLSMGSNIGNRYKLLNDAVNELANSGVISDIKISSVFETEPYGPKNQPWFLNMAISGKTEFPPFRLICILKSLEYLLGRRPRAKWHEREVDIDILFFDADIIESKSLKIPHPDLKNRRFVLLPASEIAGSWKSPLNGESIIDMLENCEDETLIVKSKRKIEIK